MTCVFGFAVLAIVLSAAVVSAEATAADDIAAGERLFHIGGCTNCHTAKGGERLAGGDPIRTPFGTFYPPNITPDPETGIGRWTVDDFLRAMRDGRAPDGSPYYPAFPYTSYHRMSEPDLRALWAFLQTIEPISRAVPAHELGFPWKLRFGLYAWQWLFHQPQPFTPDPTKDELWNRGAYLVLGPGHCAECHTPRNWLGALDRERMFAGNPVGPGGDEVPNITSDPEKGIGAWSLDQLVFYLEIGMRPDGDFAGGEMKKVIENGTSRISRQDRVAIATYLKSLPPAR